MTETTYTTGGPTTYVGGQTGYVSGDSTAYTTCAVGSYGTTTYVTGLPQQQR